METQNISVNINNEQLEFAIGISEYNALVNELSTHKSKVSAFKNFLTRTVTSEYQETLKKYLNMPSAPLQIGGFLLEEYTPELEISLGKSTNGSSS